MRKDFSYPPTKTTGQCRLDQNQEAPVLGGQEIQSNTYPQHGSIHLEKLPLGTDSIIWTRGDSTSRPGAGVPKKKLRVRGNAKSVSTSCKLCCLNVLYMKSLQFNLFGAWVGMLRKLLLWVFLSDCTVISFSQWNRHSLHSR